MYIIKKISMQFNNIIFVFATWLMIDTSWHHCSLVHCMTLVLDEMFTDQLLVEHMCVFSFVSPCTWHFLQTNVTIFLRKRLKNTCYNFVNQLTIVIGMYRWKWLHQKWLLNHCVDDTNACVKNEKIKSSLAWFWEVEINF